MTEVELYKAKFDHTLRYNGTLASEIAMLEKGEWLEAFNSTVVEGMLYGIAAIQRDPNLTHDDDARRLRANHTNMLLMCAVVRRHLPQHDDIITWKMAEIELRTGEEIALWPWYEGQPEQELVARDEYRRKVDAKKLVKEG